MPPTQNYCVQLRGPNVLKNVHVAVPVHLANALKWGKPSVDTASIDARESPTSTHEPRMSISYQPREGDPHLQMSASAEELTRLLANWSINPADANAAGVTDIKITPAGNFNGRAHMLTFAPAPQEQMTENHQSENALDPAKILDILASTLTIAAVASEQVKKRRDPKHVVNQWTRTEYRVDGGSVILTRQNTGNETVITVDDLATANENDKRLISTWAAAAQTFFNSWASIYPKRQSSADPEVNAEVEKRLDDLQHSMCAELTKLKQFVERTHKKLSGFEAVETVCQG